jgi:AAA domain
MPIDVVAATDIKPFERLKLAIVGDEKTGKSRLASTAPKPILFFDFDNRKESIAGIPGVYVISFRDNQLPQMPDAAPLALSAMSSLERSLDLFKLELQNNSGGKWKLEGTPEGTTLKTLVIDTAATMARAFMKYELAANSDLRREVAIGATKVQLPRGFDAWNAETEQAAAFINRAIALGVNVILIMHETKEKSADSTQDDPKYTGKVSVYPNRYAQFLKLFNEVWRVKLASVPVKEGNTTLYKHLPRVYPLPTAEFNAASALLLDPVEEPNIEAMVAKHQAKQPR